ncbi:microviridin/marinostatin family tricyclic proteinase inhibitor [Melittangium boletus]|uniref:Microviridin/marinostatin family tricyclic proteinase inhibitor n=1 Tax=Melittangium boletus DSM 14713 TaxID=1294270 RepID=A0A250IIL1_9BACT|nr:microviridin/marinostatin family tricyclic proteinase inhibitor [Melittangium boletus]ATB31585.1 hypothetical protein MEBOL_005048 [Melittangium boletus DSM 14713]
MKTQPDAKPFFARLLDEQEPARASGGETRKYPSDEEDFAGGAFSRDWTLKYPSDHDEDIQTRG